MSAPGYPELVAAHRAGDQSATRELIARSTPIVLGAKVIARWWPLLRSSGWDGADRQSWAAEVVLTAATTYDPARSSWSTYVVGTAHRLIQREPALRQYRRRSDAGLEPAVRVSLTTRDGRQREPGGATAPRSGDRHEVTALLDRLAKIDPDAARTVACWAAGHPVSQRRRDAALARAREVAGLACNLAKTSE